MDCGCKLNPSGCTTPVLEAFGLDYHKVLAAVSDRLGGNLEVSAFVGRQFDFETVRFGPVLQGVFHADGGTEDAYLDVDHG